MRLEGVFSSRYFLHFKEDTNPIPPEFRRINLSLHKFVLYEKKIFSNENIAVPIR